MSGRLRVLVPVLLVVGVVVAAVVLTGFGPRLDANPNGSPGSSAAALGSSGPVGPEATLNPEPTPRPPLGGTELYGYLPYWQMNDAVAEHLRSTPVTTLGLFSVTARRNGSINTNPQGYRRITGDIGRRLIRDAHDRDTRVELVFSSFGATKNGRFFGRIAPPPAAGATPEASTGTGTVAPWHRTVDELVALAVDLEVDGINVDIELLDPADRAAYLDFLTVLRSELREAIEDAQLSVATEAGERGIGNAATAASAGVDRVFLMGYDYHWGGSPPGASSPVDRFDGVPTLRWSIGRYVQAGVPRDRILLGLPLYGMTWRTIGPDRDFAVLGNGVAWLPHQNVETLADATFEPTRDPIEVAEWFAEPDGSEWLITYYDSPATLRSKLALARDQGLAGGGFWALGYDRGLPGYSRLMGDFRDGEVTREEAPPHP